MEEHAESKFRANQEIKKRYNVKLALAQKANDTEQVASLTQQQKDEKAKCESDLQEKSKAGKDAIKTKYNKLATEVQVNVDQLVKALTGGQFKPKVQEEDNDLDDLNFDSIKL